RSLGLDDQQRRAHDQYCDADPAWNDLSLLFGDRELEWSELAFVRFLGVFEVTVDQTQNATDQQDDSDYPCRSHLSLRSRIVLVRTESAPAECSPLAVANKHRQRDWRVERSFNPGWQLAYTKIPGDR